MRDRPGDGEKPATTGRGVDTVLGAGVPGARANVEQEATGDIPTNAAFEDDLTVSGETSTPPTDIDDGPPACCRAGDIFVGRDGDNETSSSVDLIAGRGNRPDLVGLPQICFIISTSSSSSELVCAGAAASPIGNALSEGSGASGTCCLEAALKNNTSV